MSEFLLDANICVYAFDKGEPIKQNKARFLLNQRPCISSQVIIETYLACSRKLKLSQSACEENTRYLCDISKVVSIDSSVIARALQLKQRFQFSFLDSMIVASALAANCTTLFSEDMQHAMVIDSKLTIINPF